MLPPVKFHDAGKLNEDLIKIICANSRTPEKVMGDIRAMVAGINVGARRLQELVEKYGLEKLQELVADTLDYSERMMRAEIRIPPGSYQGSYTIQDDGIDLNKSYTVRVRVTIEGSNCHVDFTGTDRQARGAINAAFSQAISGAIFALRCFLDPAIPMNEGCFRPVRLTMPEGTLVNPRRPRHAMRGWRRSRP
jgi:N-methylhydantoinase B